LFLFNASAGAEAQRIQRLVQHLTPQTVAAAVSSLRVSKLVVVIVCAGYMCIINIGGFQDW